jgi:membrane associated rhomboid family serine protease
MAGKALAQAGMGRADRDSDTQEAMAAEGAEEVSTAGCKGPLNSGCRNPRDNETRMPRYGSTMLSFPRFGGATRQLVLANLAVYVLVLLSGFVPALKVTIGLMALTPLLAFKSLYLWQLVTYAFVQTGLFGVLFNLLSLWFIGAYLEAERGSKWLLEIYFLSVVGGGALAGALSFTGLMHLSPLQTTYGALSGIFGLLAAFAVLFGDQEFMLFPLPIGIRAKYLTIIYVLIALVSFVGGSSPLTYLVELTGGLCGFLYARSAPRRGYRYAASEQYFGWRNRYYRWKRARAARKFEVYMRKQDRNVSFDKEGRYIDPDDRRRMH